MVFKKSGKWKIYSFKNRIKTGDWTKQGFPYFSGTITYKGRIFISSNSLKNASSVFLNFPSLKDIAEIKINGKKAGILWYSPYRIEIKKYLQAGINKFEFKITNASSNLILCKIEKAGILKNPGIEIYTT